MRLVRYPKKNNRPKGLGDLRLRSRQQHALTGLFGFILTYEADPANDPYKYEMKVTDSDMRQFLAQVVQMEGGEDWINNFLEEIATKKDVSQG